MKCVSIFGGFNSTLAINIYKKNGYKVFFYDNPALHLINIDKCKRFINTHYRVKVLGNDKHTLFKKTNDIYVNLSIFLETCDHIGLLNVEYHRKYYDFYYSKLNNTVICSCKNNTIIDVPFIDSLIKINTHYAITSFGFH